jgi:lysophospholipase L1-like esterase
MLIQVKFIDWLIMHIPVLPFLAIQGKRLKKAIPMLPGADKNIKGSYGNSEQEINIITLGESSIAGVGIDDHIDGVSGQIAKTLGDNKNVRVNWHVMAESGYNAKKVTYKFAANLPESKVDLIVIGLGANDTFELNSPQSWLKDFKQLIYVIRQKQPSCPIIISPLPPVGEFPAFSNLMKQVFGTLIGWHGTALKQIPKECGNVYYMDEPIKCTHWLEKTKEAENIYHFFSDGIHPSKLAYSLWGKEVGQYIINNKLV